MNVSGADRIQTNKTDKMGVIVAQRSLEAARQNQESGKTQNGKKFAHPYLGHNVDIYV